MWVFRRSILPRLNLTSNGWNMSEEIEIEAILAGGIEFGEYHIDYVERIGQTKHLHAHVGVENMFFLLYKRLRHGRKVPAVVKPEGAAQQLMARMPAAKLQVVDVGAGGAGDEQVAQGLEEVVGVVVGEK